MKIRTFILYIILFSIFNSCNYDFPEDRVFTAEDLGEINIENFITAGDGFLAGVMDGSLYTDGQKKSVANIMASQFSLVDELKFSQSSINSENGYNLYVSAGSEIFGKWKYIFGNNTDEKARRVLTKGESVKEYTGDKNALNDISVPQLYVKQLSYSELPGNPFYSRIFKENGTSISDQIVEKSPTFIICWMGINDFLNFAVHGATNPDDFTSGEDFQSNYTLLIDELIQNTNSKIVIGNLPSFEDLPFFYIRQYDFLKFTNKQLSTVYARYSEYNDAVAKYNVGLPEDQKRPLISFNDNGVTLYPQPIVVIDESLPDAFYPDGKPLEKFRQLNEDEMALFSITDAMVENGMGSLIPINEEFYLNQKQISDLKERVFEFNRILNSLAQKYPDRITLVDIASPVKKIADTGKYDSWGFVVSEEIVYFEGVPLEGGLDLNSIFSLDGIHFNQRGNAFIANAFIREINNSFHANIPMVDVNDYIGNLYHLP